MTTKPTRALEVFDAPSDKPFLEVMVCPEFTCLCPKTGQPDFATITLEFVPDKLCVELKALKLYLWSFRDEGHFHEKVTNMIADDLENAMQPRFLRVIGDFWVRGGITTKVFVERGTRPAFVPEVRL